MSLLARRWAPPGRFRGDSGSAVVEFVFLTVLLMVPLLYLVMTLSRVQAGAYAASTAAREAGRVYVTAQDDGSGSRRAELAARIAFEDQGFDATESGLSITCDAQPCLRPQGRVEVSTLVVVPLPLVPSFAREVVPLEVPIRASHVVVVDRFRGQP